MGSSRATKPSPNARTPRAVKTRNASAEAPGGIGRHHSSPVDHRDLTARGFIELCSDAFSCFNAAPLSSGLPVGFEPADFFRGEGGDQFLTWAPAGARPRAGQRPDPWAGVTELVTALVHRRPLKRLKRMNGSEH